MLPTEEHKIGILACTLKFMIDSNKCEYSGRNRHKQTLGANNALEKPHI